MSCIRILLKLVSLVDKLDKFIQGSSFNMYGFYLSCWSVDFIFVCLYVSVFSHFRNLNFANKHRFIEHKVRWR